MKSGDFVRREPTVRDSVLALTCEHAPARCHACCAPSCEIGSSGTPYRPRHTATPSWLGLGVGVARSRGRGRGRGRGRVRVSVKVRVRVRVRVRIRVRVRLRVMVRVRIRVRVRTNG